METNAGELESGLSNSFARIFEIPTQLSDNWRFKPSERIAPPAYSVM